jgi:hypothetical protein
MFPSEGFYQHTERDSLVVCFGESEEVSPEGEGKEGGGIKFKKDK